mmetsp:Transcript_17135/g.57482  ORF Transcript_17135/g.57482 Transcript_17135/m.57482 type:complete len:201 (+) Transcript_17135:1239-1841(+)
MPRARAWASSPKTPPSSCRRTSRTCSAASSCRRSYSSRPSTRSMRIPRRAGTWCTARAPSPWRRTRWSWTTRSAAGPSRWCRAAWTLAGRAWPSTATSASTRAWQRRAAFTPMCTTWTGSSSASCASSATSCPPLRMRRLGSVRLRRRWAAVLLLSKRRIWRRAPPAAGCGQMHRQENETESKGRSGKAQAKMLGNAAPG